MHVLKNIPLASYTSLGCGGPAEQLLVVKDTAELEAALHQYRDTQISIFGFGTNSLISDEGIKGTVIITKGGSIIEQGELIIADAGVWWDSLVEFSLAKKLWGIELTSGIPSSVGGAVVGNIAAYGQQVSSSLEWVDVFDLHTGESTRIANEKIKFEYRASSLQQTPHLVVLRAAFRLSPRSTTDLDYASALSIADELKLDTHELEDRRAIILEARKRAGSLYDPEDSSAVHTAGSFFKNPLVDVEQAKKIAAYDESGKSLELLMKQNKIHGGSTARASAAHVLLAAGFHRGQSWGPVRLHPDHILKIENTGGATAQQIYDVAHIIIKQVKEMLDITLVPEVRFIGAFKTTPNEVK